MWKNIELSSLRLFVCCATVSHTHRQCVNGQNRLVFMTIFSRRVLSISSSVHFSSHSLCNKLISVGTDTRAQINFEWHYNSMRLKRKAMRYKYYEFAAFLYFWEKLLFPGEWGNYSLWWWDSCCTQKFYLMYTTQIRTKNSVEKNEWKHLRNKSKNVIA